MFQSEQKFPAKRVWCNCLKFAPRFDFGNLAQVAVIAATQDGTELGVGYH